MIKKIMFASLLLLGGACWAMAQSQGKTASKDVSLAQKQAVTIPQLFERIEESSKALRTSKTGVEAANLGIESAKSKRLPDLDASLSFSFIGNALLMDRDFRDRKSVV